MQGLRNHHGYNCTFMELKWYSHDNVLQSPFGYNCTFMELK